MLSALDYAFFQRALLAALLASVAAGVIGSYVVVKRISSVSGGIAHAAFGGLGLAHLFGFDPMVGAAGFGLAAGLGIGVAYRRLGAGLDTLIAMVWAVGMALGVLFIALTPGYAPRLDSYLFGNVLLVSTRYLLLVAGLDFVALAVVALLFEEIQAVMFDEEFARVLGMPVEAVLLGVLGLTALTVVVLIRLVGVILVIALLTMPAAIARQWSKSLLQMMQVATAIAAVCSVAGLFLSYGLSDRLGVNLPSGPLIILLVALVYVLSAAVRAATARRVRPSG